MAKILLVEDDPELANNIRSFLLFEKHTVVHIADGQAALQDLVNSPPYELIILDWELPNLNGIEIVKRYRNNGGKTPVLMLTGHNTVDDMESGLDSGADDYLTKPFDTRVLNARLRALLRRPAPVAKGSVLKAGAISVDMVKHSVTVNNEVVSLLPREFQLLEFFMSHPDQVFAAELLQERVWPNDSEVTLEAIRTALKRMRKKVDPKAETLRTIHGIGYILDSDKSE